MALRVAAAGLRTMSLVAEYLEVQSMLKTEFDGLKKRHTPFNALNWC